MPMVIPAVDIRGGRCVRLLQGRADRETVYFDHPADAARLWAEQGAELIHVVDLDGAFEGRPTNFDIISAIARELPVPIEVGGGIRTDAAVERYLEAGVQRVILGSRALREPEWLRAICQRFPGRIVAGVDARDGRVAIEGWAETSNVDAIAFAHKLDSMRLRALIFTDVATDGALRGPNLGALRRLLAAVATPVVASGGIASLDDVRAVAALGVEGMIIGKALFDGAFALREAIQAASEAE
ncbi:MAG TPA: 1-(5-phosphoribosyl)-5-[(5-phosphoribosylamino)methylideneamino]imidazole-4-carboxamide isomerase [Planctomycetota bacterium]|nr:1-(5-phosphoribosyl)-5-[(5-phosphoribosylamino)methylideneamino]imidazole-4-carboxamide isomerase [Planctomycetota bacterium]HRR80291.1 1-(5-phosphoribosyl)-5-[(5-phosphoribosylamino)methylideneamino]imidazole-4-carboxamide isomerase [Planctomycetota bacterium]HRT95933.1 1-(5-phosphoribosyl)-5-[(5-phosphoribosylamino)methylideneamino]imidazole-4-carboxamide isomerase [Planctomycetota bacterium]